MKNSDSDEQKAIPLIIVGASGAGKTCILEYFVSEYMGSHLTTLGLDFKAKSIDIDGKKVKLQIWDTAGQEKYRTVNKSLYRAKKGFIFTYSCCDKASFQELSQFLKMAEDNAREDICKILVGNKKDISEREVTYEEGKQFAESYNMKFIETSAKTGENIAELFTILTNDILQKEKAPRRKRPGSFMLTPGTKTENKDSSRCC